MDKKLVRQNALIARKTAHQCAKENAGISLLVDTIVSFHSVDIIAGYMAISSELNPLAAMEMVANSGKRLCLPVVESSGKPLFFREWTPNSVMIKGAFGAQIPSSGVPMIPDLLIVPLVAFDRTGARLGYGGGFYDRSLEQLRNQKHTIAIGFAYASQEVEKVPVEQTDQPLDLLVTENEIIYFNK